MIHNPYRVVEMFEENLAEYCGSPYAVTVDSCTNALFLCCLKRKVHEVTIPAKTYLSVPQAIIHAGGKVKFEDREWHGEYQLKPYSIWDASKRMKRDMYHLNDMGDENLMCLSFHHKKHLPIGKGGAILCSSPHELHWFKKMRYEARSEMSYWNDDINMLGHNMYMTPEQAARGLILLSNLNDINDHLEEDYRDLREFTAFKDM
tara:strand:+ start:1232 stop:1843 length:612 start_codon:yes stop_codon:yes gene_type:complete